MIKLAKIWLLIIFLIISAFACKISQSYSFSIHFVDEEDHIIFAQYINQNYKLYTGLSSNHQPIPYLFSAVVQKVSSPPNMPMLIKRHRQAIFLYTFIWGSILVYFFRWQGLSAWTVIEMLKYSLLGNQVLAESLALYPAMFIFFYTLQMLWSKKNIPKIYLYFLGLSIFICGFNLVPLWPFLLLILIIWIYRIKKDSLPIIAGIIMPTFLLFCLINPLDWYRETIYNNTVYAMPQLNSLKTPLQKASLLVLPFLVWNRPWFSQTMAITMGFIIFGVSLWMVRKEKKKLSLILFIYLVAIISNTRVNNPSATIYEGFHLLPWLGIWIVFTIFLFNNVILVSKYKLVAEVLGFIAFIILFSNRSMPYFETKDTATEYYINYSNFEDYARILQILHQPQDRLAVLTSESLIYWNTGMKPATRQIVYYPWEESVPDLKKDYQDMLTINMPEFVYGSREQSLTLHNYINVIKNDKVTELFVRIDRTKQITPEQLEAIKQFGFSIK